MKTSRCFVASTVQSICLTQLGSNPDQKKRRRSSAFQDHTNIRCNASSKHSKPERRQQSLKLLRPVSRSVWYEKEKKKSKNSCCAYRSSHTHTSNLHSFPSHEPAAAISMYPWGLKLETFNVGFQTNLNEEDRGCGKVFRSSGSLTLR